MEFIGRGLRSNQTTGTLRVMIPTRYQAIPPRNNLAVGTLFYHHFDAHPPGLPGRGDFSDLFLTTGGYDRIFTRGPMQASVFSLPVQVPAHFSDFPASARGCVPHRMRPKPPRRQHPARRALHARAGHRQAARLRLISGSLDTANPKDNPTRALWRIRRGGNNLHAREFRPINFRMVESIKIYI